MFNCIRHLSSLRYILSESSWLFCPPSFCPLLEGIINKFLSPSTHHSFQVKGSSNTKLNSSEYPSSSRTNCYSSYIFWSHSHSLSTYMFAFMAHLIIFKHKFQYCANYKSLLKSFKLFWFPPLDLSVHYWLLFSTLPLETQAVSFSSITVIKVCSVARRHKYRM